MKIRKNIGGLAVKIAGIVLFGVLSASCNDKPRYPIEPHIEFVSFKKIQDTTDIDNEGILTVSYTDGDGDLGNLDVKDSTTNYFIIYQEKQNGVYETPEELIDMFNASLPRFISSDKKQSIDGTIQRKLVINNPFSLFDTIRFQCWLVDRAGHESNRIYTDEIVVKKK
ncbi:MAG: hypothetical protein FWH36_03460 [Lentimicrobiaceae bacterium]|nr:hypothetical protein [Lentimicrobiaceae bacterium]